MMLEFIDRIAGKWLDYRMKKAVEKDPVLREEFSLKKMDVNQGYVNAIMSHPAIAYIAADAGELLEMVGVKNYFQFDLQPRIDRGLRRIRVTIQYANGISPGEKAGIYEGLLKKALPHVSPDGLNDEIKKALEKYSIEEPKESSQP